MDTLIAVVMMITGLLITMRLFGSGENILLFISSLLFFAGVELFVITNFDLIFPFNFRILSVFAIASAGMLTVYFNNLRKLVFLAGSAGFSVLSWLSVKVFPEVTIDIPFLYANRILTTLVFLIIIAGLIILINRRIKNHSEEE